MRAAFYAPLKSPGHPAPSGDRTMARLLMKALDRAGYATELASDLRTFEARGDGAIQNRLREASLAEAERLIRAYRARPAGERPALWLTYHVYYKAPDWLGPQVADALEIPYVVAEGTRAGKRALGPFALGHRGAEAALDAAAVILVPTRRDREALERNRPAPQRLVDFPPFLDLAEWPDVPHRRAGETPRLLAVGMMRTGDKLASYRQLAEALALAADRPWSLDIAGSGEAADTVATLFACFGERVRILGQVDSRETLARLYAAADLMVWPAVNEAYGMALLEAQAFGCPVLAGAHGGVASVVRPGETGILTAPDDVPAFTSALRSLLADTGQREAMGAAARTFVRGERTLDHAAARLRETLDAVVAETAPRGT